MTLNLASLMWTWFSPWQDPAPLLNTLLRSTLLLAVALRAGMWLRDGRPETRVLVYRAGLLCALGVVFLGAAPFATTIAARWNIALYSTPVDSSSGSVAVGPVAAERTVRSAEKGAETTRTTAVAPAPLILSQESERDRRIDSVLPQLLALWPLVSMWLLMRLGWCHLRIVWMRRRAQVVHDEATLERLRRACAAIGVPVPALRCSAKVHGPLLCGVWRPMIVLPSDYAGQFDATALWAIFLHEAAHIRGRDCAWTYARRIACALLWPQLLLWVLSRQIEVAGEEVCDMAVIEGGCPPRDYARTLVDLAERLCLTRTERAVSAGVVPRRTLLPRRVKQILKGTPEAPRWGRGVRWGVAALALSLGAASVAVAVDTNTPVGDAGEISGRVVYEDGRPAAGVGVEADMWESDDTRLFQRSSLSYEIISRRTRNMLGQDTSTGADGTYRIKGLLAGATFNVMVHGGSLSAIEEAGPPGWVGAAQMVKPQKGKNTRAQDVVLTHGSLIEGRIEDGITGKALANMSIGCHGPHRPLSTGFITGTRSDSNGHFTLRVPPGKSWVYWNGPVENLRAQVRYGGSTYEKDISIVRNGGTIYSSSDFVSVSVEKGPARYTRSGNGGMREASTLR